MSARMLKDDEMPEKCGAQHPKKPWITCEIWGKDHWGMTHMGIVGVMPNRHFTYWDYEDNREENNQETI